MSTIKSNAETATAAAVASSDLLGVGVEYPDGSVACAACGCEAEWEECGACGGEGGHDGYEEDPLWYQPGEIATCPQCSGYGGDWWCPNDKCQTQMITKLRNAKPTPNVPS